jgi:hypothetical protein
LTAIKNERKSNLIYKVMSLFTSKPMVPDFSPVTAKLSAYIKKANIKSPENNALSQTSYAQLSANNSTLAKGSKQVIELQERQKQPGSDAPSPIDPNFKL